MRIERRLLLALLPMGIAAAGLITSPSAGADCVSSAGTTLCSQGDARGGDTGHGPGSMTGPYVPYPCAYDWFCDSRGPGFTIGFW